MPESLPFLYVSPSDWAANDSSDLRPGDSVRHNISVESLGSSELDGWSLVKQYTAQYDREEESCVLGI